MFWNPSLAASVADMSTLRSKPKGFFSVRKTAALITLLFLPVYSWALNVPSTVSTSGTSATFTISWTCSSTYCVLQEKTGTSWTGVVGSPETSTSVTKPLGSYTYRLQTCTVTGGQSGTTTTCTFSAEKTVTVVSSTTAPAKTISYEYDEIGRLEKVTRKSGKVTSYEYDDADNRRKKITN